jgi:four helix bundle protein
MAADKNNDNKTFSETLKKRIYQFVLDLVKFIEALPKNDDLNKVVRSQLLRSGTSIGANYIEAIAGSSEKDFVNFLSHGLKSANESKFWLALLRDTGKGDRIVINMLLKELTEIANILTSSIRTMRMKRDK